VALFAAKALLGDLDAVRDRGLAETQGGVDELLRFDGHGCLPARLRRALHGLQHHVAARERDRLAG
jgi:hypothetical protein